MICQELESLGRDALDLPLGAPPDAVKDLHANLAQTPPGLVVQVLERKILVLTVLINKRSEERWALS